MTRRVLFLAFVACAVACGLSVQGTEQGGADAGNIIDASAQNNVGVDGSNTPDASSAADVTAPADTGAVVNDSGSTIPLPVYGITSDTLYEFDPTTSTLTKIGPLSGCDDDMSDIALNAIGVMFGTGDSLYTINPATGACTDVSDVGPPFTLTFVPKGTVSATNEALVAFSGADYVQIDQTSGNITALNKNAIDPYSPSGDVVSGVDAGTFVSVTHSSTDCPTDCLLQVNATDGTILKDWGASGSSEVYGLALSAGVLYGFLGNGDIVRFVFGANTVTSTVIPLTEKPTWIGAGSSTLQVK